MTRNGHTHVGAKRNFVYFAEYGAHLLTSSFILVETIALFQRRVGLTPVHDFQSKIIPLLEAIWVDNEWYTRAIQRFFALNDRNISLVDCLSFEIMESRETTCVFSFDKNFQENEDS